MNAPFTLNSVKDLNANIKVLFTDVDDTLTWQGKLPAETFLALQTLKDNGIRVIPVTGACSGWCDCIIRTWPIDTIIGENGSFWMERQSCGSVTTRFQQTAEERNSNLKKLENVAEAFGQAFPMIPITQDQKYRETDIAFDVGQETKIDRKLALEATQWLNSRGINARLSSIHINAWIGDYNKAETVKKIIEQTPQLTEDSCAFIGDSPNDESMFETLTHTVGVANITPLLEELIHTPRYLCTQPGGYGFVELANQILKNAQGNKQ